MTYRVVPRLSLGVEFNPRADEVGPLANWVAVTETEKRPALMFGLSSDRIGTPEGEAYFFTLSKNLEGSTGLPVAPYVGGAYGTFDDEFLGIGGIMVRFAAGFSGTVIYDGKAVHPTMDYRFLRRHVITALWVDMRHLGVAYSVAF